MLTFDSLPRALRALMIAATLAFGGAAVPQALAQDEPDAPARVGRISEVAGEIFLARGERANEWAPVGRNYPVTTGDTLWVVANGRAEVDFGAGRFWMGGDANLHVVALDERALALFVASGTLIVRVRMLDPGDAASIETPNTRIDIHKPGYYRIDVAPDLQRTLLTVRDGAAGVAFAGGVQQAVPGQQVNVRGDAGSQISIQSGFGSDAFDAWSFARNQRYDASPALSYVAADMVGARDLDDYGTWENQPTYGAVWFPTTVAVGWAPYRYGEWTWIPPWGWTWVDSAPWGYAPSHYGRWVWLNGRWGWCPGARIARAVWAPALVGWYGGKQWVNAAGPVYGWVPLAWGEPYNPGWGRCGGQCWRRYNQPYAVTSPERPAAPPAHYANAAVPGALSAIPASTLADARPVAANLIGASTLGGGAAPVLGGAPPIKPTPGHYMTRPVPAAPVPASAQYQLMTRSAPTPAAVATTPAAAPSGAVAPRRDPAQATPPATTARNVVVAPPVADARSTPVRGAYTGVPPTPGPKAPAAPERVVAVPASPPAPAGPMTRNAPVVPVAPSPPSAPASAAPGQMTRNASPVAVVPPAPPRSIHGGTANEGETRAPAPAKPATAPSQPAPPGANPPGTAMSR